MANEIKQADKIGEKLGLTKYEMAFYDAVASNKNAKELLDDLVLRQLVIYLVETVKANVTIDWSIKESILAKSKVMGKRALRNFGYPPDQEKLATETVKKKQKY